MSVKLNLGGGNNHIDGFTTVDKYDKEAHVRADIVDLPYKDGEVDEIICLQVVEHLPYQQSSKAIQEMHRVLRPGGRAHIECPDIDVVCRKILEEGLQDKWIWNLYGQYYRPWDKERYEDWENNAASIHRNAWNLKRFKEIAEPLGFRVRLLDWHEKSPEYRQYEENLGVELLKPL